MRIIAVSWIALSLAAIAPAHAQTSASFKLTEAVFNNGGDPNQGSALASPHYHIKLDAIGDGVIAAGLSSASYHADAGFVADYPPPGEVSGLNFASKTDLAWNGERSAGTYNLYRDSLGSLPGAYGTCDQPAIQSTAWAESATPPTNSGWFYLATAKNRLREEGTKGYLSVGTERSNSSPCP